MPDNQFVPPYQLKTPVLFLVFNRPDTTKQVFEAIRKARPAKLYVAADGPRENNETDAQNIKQVKSIVTNVDWNCELKTLFRNENLGCKIAVSSAIDWFFENEEEGIILEDDCLPHASFFRFCEELLDKYREDKRICMISGDNFQFGRKRTEYSYYFSRYPHIWGWASWRRVWRNYDVNMELWPKIRRDNWLYGYLWEKECVEHWTEIFDNVYEGKIDTWDYQWVFTSWIQNSLVILPNVNLVSNIGFGESATHTTKTNILAQLEAGPIKFPLLHPPFMLRDCVADRYTEKLEKSLSTKPIFLKIVDKLRSILKYLFK
jgi:hypothetical protein